MQNSKRKIKPIDRHFTENPGFGVTKLKNEQWKINLLIDEKCKRVYVHIL